MRLLTSAASGVFFLVMTASHSALAGSASVAGLISMGGTVIETACAIHPDHREQSVTLKSISPDRLIRDGSSELHPFSIHLINCSPERQDKDNWLAFQITFEGQADGNHFALQGESQGLALEIQDDRGHIAAPGIAMPVHPVPSGDKRLNYHLRLIGNQQLLQAGSHFALLKYKLDYY
ncbi:fimbrial protein [Serratia proteamaculans]|uniref:fimbrial protein n=1 Tax=Serratia proteamaculans TaxID=28151 RepID=UPI0039B028B7